MGYFSNGAEGMDYQYKYCDHCAHNENGGCPIWDAHLRYNYEECNNKDSILHLLIPRNGIYNEQCKLFMRG